MTKTPIRSLPIAEWPTADRQAWTLACRESERLRRAGSASHLKPITQNDLACRYGYFLDYLARAGKLDPHAGPAAQVTPGHVGGYVAELRVRIGSVTQYGNIYKLRRVAELVAPASRFDWLKELEQDLDLAKKPRTKFGRAPLTELLVGAGLTLMAEADAAVHLAQLRCARQYRNGLMVALLALCPIRLKNFSSLAIGRNFVEVEGRWWIVLTAAETKEARADERPIPDILTDNIDCYVAHYRKILAASNEPPAALWLSGNDGGPMRYCSVAAAVEKTVLLTLGIKASPHMFRTSAASSAAIHAGHLPHLSSAVLHHRDETVTHEHYVRTSSVSAINAYREIANNYLVSRIGAAGGSDRSAAEPSRAASSLPSLGSECASRPRP